MRKIFLFPMAIALVTLLFAGFAHAQEDVKLFINNRQKYFNPAPVIIDGTTLIPMRAFFEALGCKVDWDSTTRTATGTRNGSVVKLTIGNKAASVNEQPRELTVEAQLINGSTFIPLRFVGEALGDKVVWEGSARTINITSSKATPHENETNANETSKDNAQEAETEKNETNIKRDDTGIREIGEAVSNGKSYADGVLVTEAGRFYLNYDMVLERYHHIKTDLDTIDHRIYKDIKFISWDELYFYFCGTGIVDFNFRMYASEPPPEKQLIDYPWISRLAVVELNGKKYSYGVLGTQNDRFYFNYNMLLDSYPQSKKALDEMEYKTYKDMKFVSYDEFRFYLQGYGITNYNCRVYTNIPKQAVLKDYPWLKNAGPVEWNGVKYPYGILINQEGTAFLNYNMIIDRYPELGDNEDLKAIDSQVFRNMIYVNRQQAHGVLTENKLGWNYKV